MTPNTCTGIVIIALFLAITFDTLVLINTYYMNWVDANREIFDEYIAAGDTFGAEITIQDAKDYGADTKEMEQILRNLKNEDKVQ